MSQTASSRETFVVRRTFLLPLGLLLALLVGLLVASVIQEEDRAKIIVLSCLLVPITGIFVESATRKVTLDSEGVHVQKFLRHKTFAFSDITSVDLVTVRKRAFLGLSTEASFMILSNAYANFPALVNSMIERVPAEAVPAETREKALSTPMKCSDIITCWLAALLILFIFILQLMR